MDLKQLTEAAKYYDVEDIIAFLHQDLGERIALIEEKDKHYGGSWQNNGLIGAFLNLKRKFDRLENIIIESGFDIDSEESIEDTFKDLSNYAAMLHWLYNKKRQEWTK